MTENRAIDQRSKWRLTGGKTSVDQDLSDERELVRSMLAGDERAFNTFFETYFPRVFRFALPRLAGDVDASKEVVQATMVKAMRNLAGYRGDAALFSWICQICRRQIVDHLRADRRRTNRVVLLEDSPEISAALESIEAPQEDEPLHRYGADE